MMPDFHSVMHFIYREMLDFFYTALEFEKWGVEIKRKAYVSLIRGRIF